jgi:hypothetical protein
MSSLMKTSNYHIRYYKKKFPLIKEYKVINWNHVFIAKSKLLDYKVSVVDEK